MILLTNRSQRFELQMPRASEWCSYVSELPGNTTYKIYIKVSNEYVQIPYTLKTPSARNDMYAVQILNKIKSSMKFYYLGDKEFLQKVTFTVDGVTQIL